MLIRAVIGLLISFPSTLAFAKNLRNSFYSEPKLSSLLNAVAKVRDLEHPYFCKSADSVHCHKSNIEALDKPVPQSILSFAKKLQNHLFGKELFEILLCRGCGSAYKYQFPNYKLYIDENQMEMSESKGNPSRLWTPELIGKFFVAHEIGHYIQEISSTTGHLPYSETLTHADVDVIGIISVVSAGLGFPKEIIDYFKFWLKLQQQSLGPGTDAWELNVPPTKQRIEAIQIAYRILYETSWASKIIQNIREKKANVIFIGEDHDFTSHRAAIIELIRAFSDEGLLNTFALEMVLTEKQDVLDLYLRDASSTPGSAVEANYVLAMIAEDKEFVPIEGSLPISTQETILNDCAMYEFCSESYLNLYRAIKKIFNQKLQAGTPIQICAFDRGYVEDYPGRSREDELKKLSPYYQKQAMIFPRIKSRELYMANALSNCLKKSTGIALVYSGAGHMAKILNFNELTSYESTNKVWVNMSQLIEVEWREKTFHRIILSMIPNRHIPYSKTYQMWNEDFYQLFQQPLIGNVYITQRKFNAKMNEVLKKTGDTFVEPGPYYRNSAYWIDGLVLGPRSQFE